MTGWPETTWPVILMGPLLGSQETNRAHDVAEDDPGGADQSSDDRHQVVVQHEALGAQGPT